MTSQRLPLLLTLLNLALLMFTLAQMRPAAAQDTAPMLRGRGLQIVDDHGRVRASIEVLPASTQKNGDRYPETVLLRLIDSKGLPHVKIATTEDGSAVVFGGDSDPTLIQLLARGNTASVRVVNKDGREQIVKP
jgi:hypothetical protein